MSETSICRLSPAVSVSDPMCWARLRRMGSTRCDLSQIRSGFCTCQSKVWTASKPDAWTTCSGRPRLTPMPACNLQPRSLQLCSVQRPLQPATCSIAACTCTLVMHNLLPAALGPVACSLKTPAVNAAHTHPPLTPCILQPGACNFTPSGYPAGPRHGLWRADPRCGHLWSPLTR